MQQFDYDAIVIGGGAAGLTASGIAANFGARTMMIEGERLGGDCTWTGCIPSKTLLKAGKVAHHIRCAGRYGLMNFDFPIDTSGLMQHLRSIREEVYEEADRPSIYENMGIEVVEGRARFLDSHTIRIDLNDGNTRTVTSKYFFICTGGHPSTPPIDGLEEVPYWTNESLFEIERLPAELVIIGGGNIGTEMAQALNRLGTNVTVIESSDRLLSHDDPELAAMLLDILKGEGVRYAFNANVRHVGSAGSCIKVVYNQNGEDKSVTSDGLLVATGRAPNLNGLGLDAAGVHYTGKGVQVNKRCQTNVRHIYACGDITGRYQFTHMSEHMAKVAATNALLKFPIKIDQDCVPWCTFTDPELAHVGASEQQLREQGARYQVYRFPYSKIDRALADSETNGLIKIYAKKWTGKILGADVLGARAGEVISEYALAMRNGVTLRNMADTIHPYPTYSLGGRRAADQWYIKNQSEWSVRLIQRIFGYRGSIPDYSDPDRIV